MKKRGIIVLSTIFLITIVTAISLGVSASTEKSIATIGEYKISESTLKTYVILSSADCDQGDTIEQSVKMYAIVRLRRLLFGHRYREQNLFSVVCIGICSIRSVR